LGVCGAPTNRTLTPLEEAKSPWCELDKGIDSKTNGGGLYRQMEVITMAIVAILIAVGVVALVFLGIFFVLAAAFYIMSSAS
jgi:hypothetical protein